MVVFLVWNWGWRLLLAGSLVLRLVLFLVSWSLSPGVLILLSNPRARLFGPILHCLLDWAMGCFLLPRIASFFLSFFLSSNDRHRLLTLGLGSWMPLRSVNFLLMGLFRPSVPLPVGCYSAACHSSLNQWANQSPSESSFNGWMWLERRPLLTVSPGVGWCASTQHGCLLACFFTVVLLVPPSFMRRWDLVTDCNPRPLDLICCCQFFCYQSF